MFTFVLPIAVHGENAFSVRATLVNGGRQLNLVLRTPNDLTCAGVAKVSTRSRSIDDTSNTERISEFAGKKSVTFLNLGKIETFRSSAVVYLSMRIDCADDKRYTRRISIELPTTRSRTGLGLNQWIARVRAQFDGRFGALPFPPTGLSLVVAFPALSFSSPIDLQSPSDGTNRLFVVEQGGRIYSILNESQSSIKTLLLDISQKISSGGERGLLGLAIDPNFSANGYIYVNYTRSIDGATVIARYTTPRVLDQTIDNQSELILLTIAQPFDNHNGGGLQFGSDGFLYIALGDGGSGGDPQGNGQRLDTLLGKILRIDVHNFSDGLNYAIPKRNPFINRNDARAEIFAYGFRNPWRISFDEPSANFWVADVGQGAREEIDLVSKGKNYGWNKMEGKICYPSGGSECDQDGLELPLLDYDHSLGKSVTGGYTYRGRALPALHGVYIYGDFISGRIWGIRSASPLEQAQLLDTSLKISSFGRSVDGEVFIIDYNGLIYRFSNAT